MNRTKSLLTLFMLLSMSMQSVLSATPLYTVGDDLADEFEGSENPPNLSITPTGIYRTGFHETFTITVSREQGTLASFRYPPDGIEFISKASDNSQATFRTKEVEGTFDVYVYIQNMRGIMNFQYVRLTVLDYLTDPPPALTGLRKITAAHNRIQIGWDAVGITEPPTEWLEVHRIQHPPAVRPYQLETIAEVVSGQTSYTDTNVQPDTVYEYAVVAANSGGVSGEMVRLFVRTDDLPPPPAQYPNLVPDVVHVPTTINTRSTNVWISCAVRNIGTVTAFEPWYVRVTESTDQIPDPNDRFVCSMRYDDLTAGASAIEDCLLNTPNVAHGTVRYYIFSVDYNDRVTESNETDNIAIVAATYEDFEPPSGHRCGQVDTDALECVVNREFYDEFEFYVVEHGPGVRYCTQWVPPLADRYESEDLYTVPGVGVNVTDGEASGGRARQSTGAQNVMQYGPYTTQYGTGTYEARFRLKVDELSPDHIGTLDVHHWGEGFLSVREIFGSDFWAGDSYVEIPLVFDHPGSESLEWRVTYDGGAALTVDRVDVRPVTAWIYQSEDLAGFSTIVPEITAVGRNVRQSNGAYWLQYGPYTGALPAGSYQVRFRLKVDTISVGHVATVDVYSYGGAGLIGERTVHGSDFCTANRYEDIPVSFHYDGTGLLEFRVRYLGGASLTADMVTVVPVDGRVWQSEHLPSYPGVGFIASDPTASNGLVRQSNGVGGWFQYGPYTGELPPGSHEAQFLLKVSELTPHAVATVDAYHATEGVRASRTLTGTDFAGPQVWTTMSLPFTHLTDGDLQFRIVYHGGAVLSADTVTVQSLAGTLVTCRIEDLDPGVYHVQVIAHDTDTGSTEITAPHMAVVSEEWVP